MRAKWIASLFVATGLTLVSGSLIGDVSSTPTKAGTETPAAAKLPPSIDDLFSRVAERVPAFGGMFIGPDQKLHVYLLDPAQSAAAEAAIREVFGPERLPEGGIVVQQGKYGFQQLKTWHDRHRLKTLTLSGVLSTSIDEVKNRLQIGVKGGTAIARVEGALVDMGVPREAVEIVETEPIHFSATLQSTQRPLLGGVQIMNEIDKGCTLGFAAVRQDRAGFVTNSHCTEGRSGVEDSVIHQSRFSGVANQIGVETVDPALFEDGDCPSSRRCRYSDAAFIARDSGSYRETLPAPVDFGYLALPDDDLTIINKYWIGGKAALPICGETLGKVGITTGFTSGKVFDTCVDINVSRDGDDDADSGITMLCQNRVAAASKKGDSGSAVFSSSSAGITPGGYPSAILHGILWGTPKSGAYFSFSSMAFVESELGSLKTGWGQPGANSVPEVKILEPLTHTKVGIGGLNNVELKAGVVDYEGCCQEVRWTSTLDGTMGFGTDLDFTFQTPGTRTVTLTAVDDGGKSHSDTIVVIALPNDPPSVWIKNPADGETLYTGLPIFFEGDSQDYDAPLLELPCSSLHWKSSNGGDLFSPSPSCTPQITFTTAGWRTIKLKGTASDGESDEGAVTVNVINPPANSAPNVSILIPKPNDSFGSRTVVPLQGKADDPDNKSPLSYQWMLYHDSAWTTLFTGTVNDGQTITDSWTPPLSLDRCGGQTVRIYLYVTDPDGKTSSAYRDVDLDSPPC